MTKPLAKGRTYFGMEVSGEVLLLEACHMRRCRECNAILQMRFDVLHHSLQAWIVGQCRLIQPATEAGVRQGRRTEFLGRCEHTAHTLHF